MDNKFLSIDEFNEQLKQLTGKQISISKMEMEDVDNISIRLDRVSYEKDTNRIDDYEALYTLILHGDGVIETDLNTSQPLPSSAYDIPLDGKSLYEFDGEHFIISTSRATYKIGLA